MSLPGFESRGCDASPVLWLLRISEVGLGKGNGLIAGFAEGSLSYRESKAGDGLAFSDERPPGVLGVKRTLFLGLAALDEFLEWFALDSVLGSAESLFSAETGS